MDYGDVEEAADDDDGDPDAGLSGGGEVVEVAEADEESGPKEQGAQAEVGVAVGEDVVDAAQKQAKGDGEAPDCGGAVEAEDGAVADEGGPESAEIKEADVDPQD